MTIRDLQYGRLRRHQPDDCRRAVPLDAARSYTGIRCAVMWLVLNEDESGPSVRRASLGDRLTCHIRSGRLDQRIANGVCPDSSGALALRALYLIKPRTRHQLARSLASNLAEATGPPPLRRSARIPVARPRIREAADQMRAVLTRLDQPGPIAARGVACVEILLCDGSGPMYCPDGHNDLSRLLDEALAAMDDPITMG
jgi:hypothetical protein